MLLRTTQYSSPSANPFYNGSAPEATGYEVVGLPVGHKAWILQADGKWRLIREMPGGMAEWVGEYSNVDAALHILAEKLK